MASINSNSSNSSNTTHSESRPARGNPLNLHRVPNPRVSVATSSLNIQQHETNPKLTEVSEYASLSDEKAEQRAKYAQLIRDKGAKMSPEKKDEYRAKNAKQKREKFAKMSPKEKNEYRIKIAENQRKWYAKMSPDQRKEYRKKRTQLEIESRAKMSPKEKNEYREKRTQLQREKRAKMSPNEKKEQREKHKIYRIRYELKKDKSIPQEYHELIIMLRNELGLQTEDALDVLRMLDDNNEPLHISHYNEQDISLDVAKSILNYLNEPEQVATLTDNSESCCEPLHISHSNEQDISHDDAELILNLIREKNNDKNPSKNKKRLKDDRNYE